jgi:hypothetical protein
MTNSKLVAAGVATALFTLLAGSTAMAAHSGSLACRTWTLSKNTPPATRCITWTHEAAVRLRAANCDPSKLDDAAMHAQCVAMMGDISTPAAGQSGS